MSAASTPVGDGEAASQSSLSKPRRQAGDCCRTCRLRKVKCPGSSSGNGPCEICARLELTCSFGQADGSPWSSGQVVRSRPSRSLTEAGTARKRAQRACRQCHSQKTKCSGGVPRCSRCEAAGLPCAYMAAKRKFSSLPTQPSSLSPQLGAQLLPPLAAERQTRAQCIKELYSQSASPADEPSPMAVLSAASETLPSKSSTSAGSRGHHSNMTHQGNFSLTVETSILEAEELLVRKNLILRHLDAYNLYLYWVPCLSFLHPEMTYRQVQDGTLEPALAAAICAASCFFVNPGDAAREFGQQCSEQIEVFLFQNTHKLDENSLFVYALSAVYNFLNGSFAKVWLNISIPTRLMLGMQVNWDVKYCNQSFIHQESLRRVAWQTFNMDRLLAGGFEEYIGVRAENMKIRLPCDERAFRENRPVACERLYDRPSKGQSFVGLQAFQLRIVDLQHRIQAATRNLALPRTEMGRSEASRIMSDVGNFQNELSEVMSALPDDLTLNDENISRHMAAQDRHGFVFLHTHVKTCHMDLYRFALPGMRQNTPVRVLRELPRQFLAKCRRRAVAYALSLARFCNAIQDEAERLPRHDGLHLAGDCTIAHIATQCLKVLLTALEHGLYQDLTDDATGCLWHNEPADEGHIRALMDGLIRVTEPWTNILSMVGMVHAVNLKMIHEFDKSRRGPGQNGTAGFIGPLADGINNPSRPNLTRDGLGLRKGRPSIERIKAREAAEAGRWFEAPQPVPVPFSMLDMESEARECDPPGLPLFLAMAEGLSFGSAAADGDGAMTDEVAESWGNPRMGGSSSTEASQVLPPRQWQPLVRMDQQPGPPVFHLGPSDALQVLHPQHMQAQARPHLPPQGVQGQTVAYRDGYSPQNAQEEHARSAPYAIPPPHFG